MNEIRENREILNTLNVNMINCIKVGSYGRNSSAIYAYLTNGEIKQISMPIYNFMIKQRITRDFVEKHIKPIIRRSLTSVGGGIACVNFHNVAEFEIEPCSDRKNARVEALFKSGANAFLYTVPVHHQFEEQEKLNDLLSLTPSALTDEDQQ